MMNERLDRFTKLLKEIFELDKSDLDFGIYRVMNLRKTQIEEFLTQRLPQMVQETLAPFAQGSKEEIRAQIAEIENTVAQMGMTVTSLSEESPMGQKYHALQKQLAEGADLTALETDVYSDLYSFFNRYYEDGDFISKRRYKEGVYAIPYEGEEVKLYWANQDQYYIKTSENFKDYTFTFDGITVHFRLVDATTEQNNNKESKNDKRVFMLFTEDEENYPGIKTFEYDAEASEIIIRFVYDIPEDKKRKYAEENYDAICNWIFSLRAHELNGLLAPIPTGKGRETTNLLEKHLKGYVAKNTFDYFIHKDLRGFLTRELDFFIKSEVMHLEDLDTDNEARVETYLAKIKAIKRVGKLIIDFLAQLEDFQKKLWLKKKFVVETNWCITLDKINEEFYSEIIANKEQIDEWITMYSIDEVEGWSNPPTVEFLQQNQNLIIDTKHFSNTFKYAVVESIPNLDEQTDGLMINGDNSTAIGLLSNGNKPFDLIYIDPPYNTSENAFLYKNNYKHSSWATMISSRILHSKQLMTDFGVIIVAIDDTEYSSLKNILENIYGRNNYIGTVAVEVNPAGQNIRPNVPARSHDYFHVFSNDIERCNMNLRGLSAEENAQYKEEDEKGMFYWDRLRRRGGNSRPKDRPKQWYPIYRKGVSLRVPNMEWSDTESEWIILDELREGEVEEWPIDPQGERRIWRTNSEGANKGIFSGEIKAFLKNGKFEIYKKTRVPEGKKPKTLWHDSKYSATSYGTKLLIDIFGKESRFSYPKSIHLVRDCAFYWSNPNSRVLDFFAGSGTTAHAVISLNREDDGKRKYTLVEMGAYFDYTTIPRVKKVVYAPDWKSGKPKLRNKGTSQIIKYMRLESYEDALSNIELSNDNNDLVTLFGEEYLVRYMVEFESRGSLLNIEAFSNPFAYTMKITEKNECKERNVDLCETFNYLIGLTVNHQSAISYFLSKPAENPAYEGAVDLVSDISGQYAFRQIDGTLPDGRRALVIWRTVTDDMIASNAALDAYFTKYRKNAQDREYDVIFVNRDNNLENLRSSNEGWKVQMTEIEFKNRMFEEV